MDELVLCVPLVAFDVFDADGRCLISKLLNRLVGSKSEEAEDAIHGSFVVLGTGKCASVPASEVERTILPGFGGQTNGAKRTKVQIPEVDSVVKVAVG
jgi:hypothetical protein